MKGLWSRSPPESGFWPRAGVWVSLLKEIPTLSPVCVLTGLMCNFIAVYVTFVQFILQLKLCLYTIVHLLLEEFKIYLSSSSGTKSLCHTIKSCSRSLILGSESGVQVFLWLESELRVLNFLTLELVEVRVSQKNNDSASLLYEASSVQKDQF